MSRAALPGASNGVSKSAPCCNVHAHKPWVTFCKKLFDLRAAPAAILPEHITVRRDAQERARSYHPNAVVPAIVLK
jgi:hypothetical protein